MSLIGEIPLLGQKDSHVDTDLVQLFPETSCIEKQVISATSELSSLPREFDRCEFGDPVAGTSGLEFIVSNKVYLSRRSPKCLKFFEELDKTGTNISYRCMDCRSCTECKRWGLIEEIRIQEEVEHDLINKSVAVEIEKSTCAAKLPFIVDPDSRLIPNLKTARKTYDLQVRKLNKSQSDHNDVIEAEDKLQKLGYVDYLENLDEKDRNMVLKNPVKYFTPWRVVWSKCF